MKKNNNIVKATQEKMFNEMEEKKIFYQAMEYAFEYSDNVWNRNVFPTNKALVGLENFEENLPELSSKPEDVLTLLHKYGSPATVSQTGGRYFGFVCGGVIPASLAVKWLTDFWDQNSVLYVTSPIVSRLEQVVENWLKQLFHLPEETVAGFVSGTSMAILSGLAAARYRILKNLDWDVNKKGLTGAPKIRIVTGEHTHSTVIKAIAILGLGTDNIELVDVDNQGRINPDKLPELDSNTILMLQAGNVNSGSFDNFKTICKIANQANSWVHVDGAFGLWVAGSKKLEHLTLGIEEADSWSVDGHKTLNTPYDSGIILCKDREALTSALQATGSYILYSEKRDGMLYTPEMSRRARVVEVWAAMKYLGRKGISELVNELHERAVQMAKELNKNRFQILNEIVFNQVLVSCENDAITNKTLELIQKSGECWCGGAEWFGRRVIRISICSWATTQDDISRSVKAFVKARDSARLN